MSFFNNNLTKQQNRLIKKQVITISVLLLGIFLLTMNGCNGYQKISKETESRMQADTDINSEL